MICLISALAFHELTTQVPHEVYVAVKQGSEPPRLPYPPVRLFWFSGDAFTEGVQIHKTEVSVAPVALTKAFFDDPAKISQWRAFVRKSHLPFADGTRRENGVSYPRVSELIHGKRGVTPDTALRLEQLFGMEAQFWLNLQLAWDLYEVSHSPAAKGIRKIKRLIRDEKRGPNGSPLRAPPRC